MARTPAEVRVFAVLTAASAVTSLVGSRIYPVVTAQNCKFPCLIYRRISTDRVATLGGDSGLEMVRIQIDCVAETYLAAKTLAGVVLDAMDAATSVKSHPDGEVDQYTTEPDAFIVSLDFQVASEEE